MKYCETCKVNQAKIVRPKTRKLICLECFYETLEEEIHYTIISNNLFKPGERVAIAASGGKDSTVLAHIMNLLNKKYNYGLDLFLLSIDEGIQGYRDDSLETVKLNQKTYDIPLKILSYKELYNWTMDQVVKQIGLNGNCTYCGVFRRQALDRGAKIMKADKMVTGHNADDMAETVLMNILRGDYQRLGRCIDIITGRNSDLPRCKPLKYTYEKEIVMYAYHKKLDYFSTECIYSPNAYRGNVRELIKDLEQIRPSSIIDIIHSAEQMDIKEKEKQSKGSTIKIPVMQTCQKCGYITSQQICKACILLEKLNAGKPKIQIELEQEIEQDK